MISNVYCVVKAALYQYFIIFIPSKFFIPSDDYFLFFFSSHFRKVKSQKPFSPKTGSTTDETSKNGLKHALDITDHFDSGRMKTNCLG